MRKLTARALPWHLPGYPDYLAALLHARGISDTAQAERFLNPSPDQLHDPFLLHDMNVACGLIRMAAEQKMSVAVYGDYDADGVCASAILISTLRELGISGFSYIPERLSEGYGLNMDAVRTLSEKAGLLISVDCGVTAVEEVALAKKLGMRVILTDHHALPETLPPADALVHPLLPGYPEPHLCGAGVVWKLACALLGQEKAMDSLDLAALATIADMVPLVRENRVITALGLLKMANTGRPGLRALMRVAGLREGAPVQAEQVAFQLAPRLNAGGRLSTAQGALSLLLTRDGDEAYRIAGELDQLNRERRDVESKVLREAAARLRGADLSKSRSLVLAGEGWNPGVVGLAASKLAERWNYPTVILSQTGEELSGSGRSAGGIDLYMALKACGDLFTRFGGHKMAAGLSLPAENLRDFQERFDMAVREQLGADDLIPETVYDCPLPLDQVSLETIGALDRLSPFGLGNPSPLFLLEGLSLLSARAVGNDGAHLKLTVAGNGAVREGIAFNQGELFGTLGASLRLVSSVDRNEFNGRVSAQLKVRAVLPGEDAFTEDPLAESDAILRELLEGTGTEEKAQMIEYIRGVPEFSGTRGTLIAARCAKTANALYRRFPHVQTFTGNAYDQRGFHAIVCAPDWSLPFARFDRVVFADGLLCNGEAARAQKATGADELLAMPASEALGELLKALHLSVEDLRHAYVLLRQGQTANLCANPAAERTALMILNELGLIQLDDSLAFAGMRPARNISPQESALFRALSGA